MLDVVIVNWNSGDHLRRCIASLSAVSRETEGMHVIVIDNASQDGSADDLEAGHLRLTVCRNATNRGFAAACNQGASVGAGQSILFLNPDTIIPSASVLRRPVEFLLSPDNDNIGLCGVQLRDESGRVATTCTRFPSARRTVAWMLGLDRIAPRAFEGQFVTDFDHLSNRFVDVVMGAFLVVRRGVFEALHGFDERFFVYYEEVDLARRAAERGWDAYFLADVFAVHVGGGTSDQIRARRHFYMTRSRTLYAQAHFGALGAAAVTATALLLEPFARALFFIARGDVASAGATFAGTAMFWWHAPRLVAALTKRGPS